MRRKDSTTGEVRLNPAVPGRVTFLSADGIEHVIHEPPTPPPLIKDPQTEAGYRLNPAFPASQLPAPGTAAAQAFAPYVEEHLARTGEVSLKNVLPAWACAFGAPPKATPCVQPGCTASRVHLDGSVTSWGNCAEHWGKAPPKCDKVGCAKPVEVQGAAFCPEHGEQVTITAGTVGKTDAPAAPSIQWVKECDGMSLTAWESRETPADHPIQHRSCRTVWFDDPGNPHHVCACPCFCCTRGLKHRGNPAIVNGKLETDADRLVRAHAASSAASQHPDSPTASGPFSAPPPAPPLPRRGG